MGDEISGIVGLTTRGENKYLYKTWKIDGQINGTYRCVRIRPTEFFTATTFNAAIKSIDRREAHRARELQALRSRVRTDS
jgi:hypothetical protein